MKKILCLLLCFVMVFALVACGSGDNGDASTNGEDVVTATSLKFKSNNYTIAVDELKDLSKELVVEPSDAKVTFATSDVKIAAVNKVKGDVCGNTKGEVTLTATSGSLKAECKIKVTVYGTVMANPDKGVYFKPIGTTGDNPDGDALVVIIPKDLPEGTDMSKAVIEQYYEKSSDGKYHTYPTKGFKKDSKNRYQTISYNGYFVARVNSADRNAGEKVANYKIENVPSGEYYGLIVCGYPYDMKFPGKKNYDARDVLAEFSATEFAKFFSEVEINEIVKALKYKEYYVGELTVEEGKTTLFDAAFRID